MPYKITDKKIKTLAMALQEMNMSYNEYAKSVKMSYTNLQMLNLITQIEECTQKKLCDATYLPKQTVNTIVTNFHKKGWVSLEEIPDNRRTKVINLTVEGEFFAAGIIPKIRSAERDAMKALTSQQQEKLIEGIQIYCQAFREKLNQEKNID